MQWPNATASATDAEGFEAGSAGSGDDSVAASRPLDGNGAGGTAGSGAPGGVQLAGSSNVPNGLAGMNLPCTGDPELFFAESPQDVESAKALCRGCQARLACLSGALERQEPWGVWGGELLLHGTVVPRKRPRGRPRKTEVAA
jgi:WhiB family transcriptional regulator, redox-sensing transcriptional regulator